MIKILIVEDELSLSELLNTALSTEYEVEVVNCGYDALYKLKDNIYNLVLLDIKLPDLNGIDIFNQIKISYPETKVIIMTAFGTIKNAVETIKNGAFDYLVKPFSIESLNIIIQKATNKSLNNNRSKSQNGDLNNAKKLIIGESLLMKDVFKKIKQVAPLDTKVLILGESGTGKELAARTIHSLSERKDKPFISINCAAIPESLMESEVFGHEKGSFTGAISKHLGIFELANGGTLFLDEIGDMSLPMQAKVLRVLQDNTIKRVGGTEYINVDVRVIAATNKDLAKAIMHSSFREDLYYRLNVFPITLPPLRERREDIKLLLNYFLKGINYKLHKQIKFSNEAISIMLNYEWPGNIRELENFIEQTVILVDNNMVEVENLPFKNQYSHIAENKFNVKEVLGKIENQLIIEALSEAEGNRQKASELLGISLRALQYKIKEMKIS